MRLTPLAYSLALAAGLLAGAGPAAAVSIYVDSPLVVSYVPNATVGGIKYRLSNANFDISLDAGTDTSGGAGSFLQANLGNHSFLSGRAYDFQLQHRAGEGFILVMTSGGTTTRLSWGTFAMPPGGTNAPTLGGLAPGASFNSLSIAAIASAGNRSVLVTNLSFTSPTVMLADGSFPVLSATNASSPQTSLVVANGDLAAYDWVLSGTVVLSRVGTGGDETVKLRIGAVAATVTIVPEPTTAALVALGLGGLARLGRPRARAVAARAPL